MYKQGKEGKILSFYNNQSSTSFFYSTQNKYIK